MDFLTKLWNYIKVKITGEEKQNQPVKKTASKKQPLFNGTKTKPNPNEITIMREITDEQIQTGIQEQSIYLLLRILITKLKMETMQKKSQINLELKSESFLQQMV